KELHVEDVGAYREMVVGGHELVNFGFDSFLGLDQDPRVKAALIRGARQWGTQFGASRAFASCGIEVELEPTIARWMATEAAVIAIDGVYSMRGTIAAMPELNEVALRHNAILYIDDAHATGVLGDQGRGSVLDALGSYDNTLVVGCLSKACSVFGAFVACTAE